jgi:capsular polysaccharide biosynthesis protein
METSPNQLNQPEFGSPPTVFANGQQPASQRSETEEVNLAQVVQFFQRHLRMILGLALLASMGTLLMTAVLPRRYEASTILVVLPPKFSSELKPETLTIQGYQKLLESDVVIAETKKRLIEQQVLKATDTLRLGKEIETRIFVSRSSEITSLAPLLQVVALRAHTPDQAAAIANTWAQLFLQQVQEISAGATITTARILGEEYPQARERLNHLEKVQASTVTEFQKRYDEMAAQWDKTLATFKSETGDQLIAYNEETARLLVEVSDQFLETNKSPTGTSRDSFGKAATGVQDTVLHQKLQRLAMLHLQAAQTPQYLTLEKALTDNLVLLAMALQKEQDVNLENLQALSSSHVQEVNPAYTELSTQLTQLESQVSTLGLQSTKIFRDAVASLTKVQQARQAGSEKLKEQRTIALAALDRQRQLELDTISRERDAQLSQFKREIAQQKLFYQKIAKSYNQAMLAKKSQQDVHLGATAVAPDEPKPRNLALKTLLALLFGAMLAVPIAFIRDAAASTQIRG